MTEIEEIDSVLSTQLDSLCGLIEEMSFVEICEFKLNKVHIEEIPWGTLNYPGLYRIDIKNDLRFSEFRDWAENFVSEWKNEKYVRKFTPNPTKKRILAHQELGDWMPLYIGKSRRIEGRVHEHIFMDSDKTTFALKLNARQNLLNDTFRLSTIRCEVKNYDLIVPVIESNLRNRINPIVGRQ